MPPLFQTDYPGAVAAFKGEACLTLDYSRDRLLHGLRQVGDDGLWWRPNPAMNAAGNLALHVCGNLRQWIVVGCDPDGALPDRRDRDGEFAADGGETVASLTEKLEAAVAEAQATIRRLNKDHLLHVRRIQIGEVTGFGAIWHSVAHLEGHAQEMIYVARLRLGDAYRFMDTY